MEGPPGRKKPRNDWVCSHPTTTAAGDSASAPAPGEPHGLAALCRAPGKTASSEGTQRRISRKPLVRPFSPCVLPPSSSEPRRAPCSAQEEDWLCRPQDADSGQDPTPEGGNVEDRLASDPLSPNITGKGQPHGPAHGFRGHRVERAFCKAASSCLKPGSPCPPVPSRPTLANAGVVPAGLAGARGRGWRGASEDGPFPQWTPGPPCYTAQAAPDGRPWVQGPDSGPLPCAGRPLGPPGQAAGEDTMGLS